MGVRIASLNVLLASILTAFPNSAALAQYADHVEVTVANVDVVVTDADGNPVRGLTKDDFAIFENGFFDDVTGGFFGELAFVEVSTNGVDFARFATTTWNDQPLGSFGQIDPLDYEGFAGVDPVEADVILRAAQPLVSLDKPVGDESDAAHFGELIPDDAAETPFEAAAESMMKHRLNEVLDNLPYRERRILELRYGLDGEPHSLESIGAELGISR